MPPTTARRRPAALTLLVTLAVTIGPGAPLARAQTEPVPTPTPPGEVTAPASAHAATGGPDPAPRLGAALLADLAAEGESHPNAALPLGDGRAIFTAAGDASNGERELYITDGTPEGTGLLANLLTGGSSFARDLTLLEPGLAVFQARSDASGGERELHITDGTPEGTRLVTNLATGRDSEPEGFLPLGDGRALFTAEGDASNGETELYVTDGTQAGTRLVVNLAPGEDSLSSLGSFGRAALLGDGRVVFAAAGDASAGEEELYVTDTTADGTALVANLRTDAASRPGRMHTMGDGRVLFTARSDASDGHQEVHITDGTAGGTGLLADLRDGAGSVPITGPRFTTLDDDRTVFAARGDASAGETEVSVTNGTEAGTGLVANLRDGGSALPDIFAGFTPLGDGRLVFPAEGDASDGETELYVTDGSEEGTGLLVDLRVGASALNINSRVVALGGGQVLFTALSDESDNENELHVTDGTPEGTRMVANLRDGRGSSPDRITPLGDGRAVYIASSDDSAGERELHLVGPVPSTPQVTVTPRHEALAVVWEPSPDPTPISAYRVVVTPDGADPVVMDLDGGTTRVIIDDLANGVDHEVVVTATSLLGDSDPSPAVTAVPGVVARIGGANRFETAALLSARAYPDGSEVAYIATGLDFPDALAGGVAAALDDAPVLLATDAAIPLETAAELERLAPATIVVLGGEAVVSADVAAELEHFADEVLRLAGPTRFDTTTAVSQAAFPDGAEVAYLATGTDFPDALAAVPAAVGTRGPLLLATTEGLPGSTATELARLEVDRIVLLGGTAALSDAVAESAAGFAPVERLDGPTRFDTAAAIAASAFGEGADRIHVATGLAFPDALTAGPIAGREAAPILLAATDDLTDATRAAIAAIGPEEAVLLGGTAALAEELVTELGELLTP